jgi:hypothetical protein
MERSINNERWGRIMQDDKAGEKLRSFELDDVIDTLQSFMRRFK